LNDIIKLSRDRGMSGPDIIMSASDIRMS
jgi:hypothetical protein